MKQQERHHHRRERVQGLLYEISFYLELIAAVLVIVLIIAQVVGLAIDMFSNTASLVDSENFNHFLELALNIVVGIEFLKMLCRHNMNAVIEVLLFTMARHLIVNQTSMLEGLLCIIAVAILFVVRKFLFVPQVDDKLHFRAKTDSEESKVE